MEELLKALTRAANAVAAYYEGERQPSLPLSPKEAEKLAKAHIEAHQEQLAGAAGVTPATAGAEAPKPEVVPPAPKAKGRPKKTEAPAATAPEEYLTPVHKKRIVDLTPDESLKELSEYGLRMVKKFNNPGAAGPDGNPAPEGYHMLKEILKTKFGKERAALLTHEERLVYFGIIAGKLANGAAPAPAPAPQPAAQVPVGLGV